jgi:hypothetical protein
MILFYVYWAAIAIIHILLAVGVYDAEKQLKRENRPTILAPGWVWAVATLIGGVVTAGIYWAINHSTLRPSEPKAWPASPAMIDIRSAVPRLITVDFDNIGQFLAGDKAPPFALGIQGPQTPVAFALNPAWLILARRWQVRVKLLFTKWHFTIHRQKSNSGSKGG